MENLSQKIQNKALELGFYACGISKADFLTEDAERLKKWLSEEKHADMAYMEGYFDKRIDPRKLIENARSVISVLYNYTPKTNLPSDNNYKISTYAYGTDYHFVLKKKLNSLLEFITTQVGENNSRGFVDSAPVLDRAWAKRAGLGWVGKNTCLITKEQGSYFFIGEIITDIELEYNESYVPNHCGGCSRCIEACPTKALTPYALDSRKCISYWTIEYRGGSIPEPLKNKFEDWIFGCDICQQVCPWNRLAEPHSDPEFAPSEELLNMRKPDWEELDEIKFKEVFKKSPVKRTKFNGLKRNIQFLSDSPTS